MITPLGRAGRNNVLLSSELLRAGSVSSTYYGRHSRTCSGAQACNFVNRVTYLRELITPTRVDSEVATI